MNSGSTGGADGTGEGSKGDVTAEEMDGVAFSTREDATRGTALAGGTSVCVALRTSDGWGVKGTSSFEEVTKSGITSATSGAGREAESCL